MWSQFPHSLVEENYAPHLLCLPIKNSKRKKKKKRIIELCYLSERVGGGTCLGGSPMRATGKNGVSVAEDGQFCAAFYLLHNPYPPPPPPPSSSWSALAEFAYSRCSHSEAHNNNVELRFERPVESKSSP